MRKKTMDDGWKIWGDNFYDAKRFFETKGNIKTKSKLKDKWFKTFKKNLEQLMKDIQENGE